MANAEINAVGTVSSGIFGVDVEVGEGEGKKDGVGERVGVIMGEAV